MAHEPRWIGFEHLCGATGVNSVTHYVGLDDHQNSAQACAMDQHAAVKLHQRCDNDLASLLPINRWIRKVHQQMIRPAV